MLKRLLLAVALLACAGSAAARDLVEIRPVRVPVGATITDVKRAIVTAAVQREWAISGSEPGVVYLTYARDDFSVTVSATYDLQSVVIAYKDSVNFGYGKDDDGTVVISSRYHSWLRYLYHDMLQSFNDFSDQREERAAAAKAGT